MSRVLIRVGAFLLTVLLSRSVSAAPPSIVLTAVENSTDPQAEFHCQGRIHGYIRLARSEAGTHLLESRWTAPSGRVAAQSRDTVQFAPARSTAYVSMNFPERSLLPGALDPELEKTQRSYRGAWRVDVDWDGKPIVRQKFTVSCP